MEGTNNLLGTLGIMEKSKELVERHRNELFSAIRQYLTEDWKDIDVYTDDKISSHITRIRLYSNDIIVHDTIDNDEDLVLFDYNTIYKILLCLEGQK